MSKEKQGQEKLFAIQVSGISCTNCVASIKKILHEKIKETDAKINVNVMQEKVFLTVIDEDIATQAVQILKTTKYIPINEPLLLSGNSEDHRKILFLINKKGNEKDSIKASLSSISGITKLQVQDRIQKWSISINYNCQMIKGRQIGNIMQNYDKSYLVINERINSLSQMKKKQTQEINVYLAIILFIYYIVVNMILPILSYTKELMNKYNSYPESFGLFSFSMIFNTLLTCYIMIFYAREYIVRAYENFKNYRVTNMETLIALGSSSAFLLFLFYLGRSIIEIQPGQRQMITMAIMQLLDQLTSASVIVLAITIGKYYENKAKKQIQKITENIFPESVLFENMNVKYVQLKNRNLVITSEKMYDVSLIEKGDILKIMPGRVLVDLIILNGSVRAVQSARTGNDEIHVLKKGDRLQSGAIVEQSQDCLAQVQNIIEKSLLIELFTHVKFAQNQEQSQELGMQAICKTISDYFVKVVIVLSIITMIVWTILLYFDYTKVDMCNFCWIVQRGIGVLVASCPCALGLAIPSVIAIVLNLATNSGILIKNNSIFQNMKMVKKIAFDKTGTLFNRLQQIQQFKILSKTLEQNEMWQILAIVEKQFRHPLAEIIYKEALNKSQVKGSNYKFLITQKPKTCKEGLSSKVLKKSSQEQLDVLIGNKDILIKNKIEVPKLNLKAQGSTYLYLVVNKEVLMVMVLNTHSDLRPEAADAIKKITEQNIEVHILSGDSRESVEKLANEINIKHENLHPQCSSFDKELWIKQTQQNSDELIIMVGDGLNDIPCLQEAGIGISINAKSELNINAADVVILSQNVYKVLALIRLINKGNLFIKINLTWAFLYNITIMPIVAGVFYHWNIVITPIYSSIAMSASSVIIVSFSHLLSCFHYDDSLLVEENHDYQLQYLKENDSTNNHGQKISMKDQIL